MTWDTTVGVDGGRRWEMTLVMTWAIMWEMSDGGDNAGNNTRKGDGRDAMREGGGLLAEDAVVAAAVAAAAALAATVAGAATAAAGAAAIAYCWGCFLFIVKIFLCGIFVFGGNWQGHTSPHTLIMLEVYKRIFGWGWLSSSKFVVCKYIKLSSKKSMATMAGGILYQSFEDKK
jgi:hypothetical protein